MTTKETVLALGMHYTTRNIRVVQRLAISGGVRAVKKDGVWVYDNDSVLKIRESIKQKPTAFYTSREVADLLKAPGLHTVERLVAKGKLTAWRTPGTTRGKWLFPKMKVLTEIETLSKKELPTNLKQMTNEQKPNKRVK